MLNPEKLYFSRQEASDYIQSLGLPCSVKTLNKLASEGGSPAFRKFGTKRVVYTKQALDAWIEERLSKPFNNTTEADAELKAGAI